MTNALLNRIRQRIEARRNFARNVLSHHHALALKMTDAPNLRALGITAKNLEPRRTRVTTVPTRASARDPRASRVAPEFAESNFGDVVQDLQEPRQIFESEHMPLEPESQYPLQNDIETVALEPETNSDARLEAVEVFELSNQEMSQDFEKPNALSEQVLSNAGGLAEIIARAKKLRETVQTKMEHVQDIPTVSTRETDAGLAEQTRSEAPKVSEQTLSQPAVSLEPQTFENHSLEQNNRATEISQARIEDKKELIQSSNNLELEALSKLPTIVREEPTSIDQMPRHESATEPELNSALSPNAAKATTVNEGTEDLIRDERLEPTVETAPRLETEQIAAPKTSEEIQNPVHTKSESISRVETMARALAQRFETKNTNVEISKGENPSAINSSDPNVLVEHLSPEMTSSQSDAQKLESQPQEPRVQTQALKADEFASEAQVQNVQSGSKTSEPQTPSASDNWQRSTPGDPQSGVVEIIRAKPPRQQRPRLDKQDIETRESETGQTLPNLKTDQPVVGESAPKQRLSERMKSLQNRFRQPGEQTRFNPDTNTFAPEAQSISSDSGSQTTPKFVGLSDVAQRLARRYNTEQQNLEPADATVSSLMPPREPSSAATEESQPLQLQESTRNFLKPLIGFDPSVARVFVGPVASEFTAKLNADGATVATDVFLKEGFEERSPEGLGLLAHELTHVGQNLNPEFVPPLLEFSSRDEIAGWSNETRARTVEAKVNSTAGMFVPGIAFESNLAHQTSTASSTTSSQQNTGDSWNGLPAPWEPMPSFAPAIQPASPVGADPSSSVPALTPSSLQVASPAVQLAETGRENPDNTPPGAASGQAHPPAQNMDVLAQQVYEILKRRLSSERRREG
jgi:hypothetical protein